MADVVIAGGGVAGASLAIMLGRAGFSVELFEQSTFPREKACGEGLMPAGVAVLERLGLADAVGGTSYYGVRYYAGARVATGRFPAVNGQTAVGRGQRRYHLDRVLFEAAAATPGVMVHTHARVEAPLVRHGRVVGLRVAGNEHMAPLVVAADGAHSRLRHQLGLDGRPARHPRVGLRAHFRLPPGVTQPPWVEIFLGNQSELYVTPLPQSEVLVAGLFARKQLTTRPADLLQCLIEAQPVLRARLMGAQRITAVKGMAPLTIKARAGVVPDAVLLGDAAGFVDPITGGGMTQALQTAELLAAYLCAAQFADDHWLSAYDQARARLLRDYELLNRILLLLARHSALARATVRLLDQAPWLFAHLLGVAAGMRGIFPWQSSKMARAMPNGTGGSRRRSTGATHVGTHSAAYDVHGTRHGN